MNAEFMKKAIELSVKNMMAGQGGPFGCVIVKEGKVVGEGWNKVTSSNDPTAHAEVSAIRDACKNLNTFILQDCEVYTSCEPCPMCLAALYWARVSKIYYANTRVDAAKIGFDDEFLYTEITKSILERKIPMEQCCRDEALKVFKSWDSKMDKIKY